MPDARAAAPVCLFHRRFRRFSGGHAKVWDYFGHVGRSRFVPRVYLTPDSLRDETNPWVASGAAITEVWDPAAADLLFLGGMDWEAVPDDLPAHIPIVNLVQGTRHAEEGRPLAEFLERRAIRICVSETVRAAITATGMVNGPMVVIPNGIELPAVDPGTTAVDVVVAAVKRPPLGGAVARMLHHRGFDVDLVDVVVPRSEFLARIGAARVAVLVPRPREGFYLPGLEAMALGTPVVMPDCGGNRAYGADGVNCLMPPDTAEALAGAAAGLLGDPAGRGALITAGARTAARHGLDAEREAFLRVLGDLDRLW